jgi:hypothetical protein
MNVRLIALTLLAAIALAGCPSTMMVPADARSADCGTGPGARCNIDIRAGSKYSCDFGRFDVDPDVVNLRGGQPVNIIWSLPTGFGFCGQDGVYLNAAISGENRQVIESFGSNNVDGSRESNSFVAANCSANWHVNYRNHGDGAYKYSIRFTHKSSGRTCTIDPFIRNG